MDGRTNTKRIVLGWICRKTYKYALKTLLFWKVVTILDQEQISSHTVTLILTQFTSKPTGKHLVALVKGILCSFYLSVGGVANMKTCTGVLISHTRCGRTGKQQPPSRALNNKIFLYHVLLCKTKQRLFTCQDDYLAQCFPLNAERWSYFPTWGCGKSWDMGQRRPTILHGLPHVFGPWSGQLVSLPPLKNKQGSAVRKEGKGKASERVEEQSVEWLRS